MKTIKRTIVLVAIVLGTLSSYAINLENTTSIVEKIEFNNVKEGQFWSIKNASGKVLHNEVILKNGSFQKEFNFSSLKNGYYTIELHKDFYIEVIPFTIVKEQVNFFKNAKEVIYKPVFRTLENKLLVSKLDFNKTSLKIQIYYENELIFKDVIKGEEMLQRVYALEKEKKGAYKVVVESNKRVFTNEFVL